MAYKWIIPCSTTKKTETKMTAKSSIIILPVISRLFCSPSEVILVVRSRPKVVNGGGFVVTDPQSNHKVVFKADGCGVLGKKEELILKDADGTRLLLIRRKGGIVEAVSFTRPWKGYKYNLSGSKELVFCLKDPKSSCLNNNSAIKISIQSNTSKKFRDLEIEGYFPDRDCTIIEQSTGTVVAQVGVREEVGQVMTNKDLYQVNVKPGIDQAFVLGVIAVLDYIYDGSTTC